MSAAFPHPTAAAGAALAPRFTARMARTAGAARELRFDNQARLVFFSDTHRADGSHADLFLPNRPLFLQALRHYFERGFTYLEVGDGDDLWITPDFRRIRSAHGAVFDLLHRFHQEQRLFLFVGNHDVGRRGPVHMEKDGLPMIDGLFLHHTPSGRRLLVTHGHQVDARDGATARLLMRTLVRPLQQLLKGALIHCQAGQGPLQQTVNRLVTPRLRRHSQRLESRLTTWATTNQQLLLCGHTHAAHFPGPQNPFYLNTGSCTRPGRLSGLEIAAGRVRLITWQAPGSRHVLADMPLARLVAQAAAEPTRQTLPELLAI